MLRQGYRWLTAGLLPEVARVITLYATSDAIIGGKTPGVDILRGFGGFGTFDSAPGSATCRSL